MNTLNSTVAFNFVNLFVKRIKSSSTSKPVVKESIFEEDFKLIHKITLQSETWDVDINLKLLNKKLPQLEKYGSSFYTLYIIYNVKKDHILIKRYSKELSDYTKNWYHASKKLLYYIKGSNISVCYKNKFIKLTHNTVNMWEIPFMRDSDILTILNTPNSKLRLELTENRVNYIRIPKGLEDVNSISELTVKIGSSNKITLWNKIKMYDILHKKSYNKLISFIKKHLLYEVNGFMICNIIEEYYKHSLNYKKRTKLLDILKRMTHSYNNKLKFKLVDACDLEAELERHVRHFNKERLKEVISNFSTKPLKNKKRLLKKLFKENCKMTYDLIDNEFKIKEWLEETNYKESIDILHEKSIYFKIYYQRNIYLIDIISSNYVTTATGGAQGYLSFENVMDNVIDKSVLSKIIKSQCKRKYDEKRSLNLLNNSLPF